MKKNLDYYMSLPYRFEIIPDVEEGGYGARFPELPGCFTYAETFEDIVSNAMDAKKAWIKAALEEGVHIAEPVPQSELNDLEEIPSQYKLRIPKSLYRSLKIHAEIEGVSMNQYCNYLLSMNDSLYSANKREKVSV